MTASDIAAACPADKLDDADLVPVTVASAASSTDSTGVLLVVADRLIVIVRDGVTLTVAENVAVIDGVMLLVPVQDAVSEGASAFPHNSLCKIWPVSWYKIFRVNGWEIRNSGNAIQFQID